MITKKQLLLRIESLENELGYVYSTDSDKFGQHQMVKGSYGILSRLSDSVYDIEEELEEKTTATELSKRRRY